MIEAAQRAEYDMTQRMRMLDAERCVPTPPEVVHAMLEAALGSQMKAAQEAKPREPAQKQPKSAIVTARTPKSKR